MFCKKKEMEKTPEFDYSDVPDYTDENVRGIASKA